MGGAVSLPALRRLLKTWQKQWRMSDWCIGVNVVERLDGDPSLYGRMTWNDEERKVSIYLARTVPADTPPVPPFESTLAHEFAHSLLLDLYRCFIAAIEESSGDWQIAYKNRWRLAEERFCNAFASALTTEEKKS